MTLDQIKDKIRKVLALADGGSDGEAESAQRQLAAMLKKYNLNIDDIVDDTRTEVAFKYRNKDELNMLAGVLVNLFGSGSEIYENARVNEVRKHVEVQLTKIERIDTENAYDYYRKAYAREKKAVLKSLLPAFIHKNALYDITERGDSSGRKEPTFEEVMRIRAIMDAMQTPTYRKQLANK